MSYRLKKLTSGDIEDRNLHSLLEECSDYFLLHEEKLPTTETLKEIVGEVPEGWNQKDKAVYIILDDEVEIGLVDILKNYPHSDTWMIGLLLMTPECRGRGVGKVIHEKVKGIALDNEVERLRIGVLQENLNGRKFWRGLGYKLLKETSVTFNVREKVVEVMTLDI